jgi:tetratricopeptide (TPR) repeat protein
MLSSPAQAQTADDPNALKAEVEAVRLYRAGKHAEATELAKQVVAIREGTLGRSHRLVCTALNNLAELYRAQGRHAEAEPLMKRGLAIWETALGREHLSVGATLSNLAEL